VAYFRLDETSGTTAADSSPSALIGTISGGVTLAQPGALRYDHGAALFNGSTGRITVPNGSYAALGTGPASVELWCRIGALPVASAFLFDTKVAGSNGAGLAVNIGPTGVLVFRAGNGSAQFNVTTLAATYHDGQWHHVVGVYTRGVNDVASIYIDGALVNAQTAPAAGWNLTSAFGLGLGMYVTDIAPSANAFTGSLDEVALYQVALTAIQVAEHYRLGRMAFPDAYVVVPAS
jgi:hypothetical protein